MTTSSTPPTPAQLQGILNGPAGTPPAGVTPEFNDLPYFDRSVEVTLAFCVTLPTLAVLTRLYTKKFLIRSWAYEDYALIVGWLFQIAEAIASALTVRAGVGVHIWNLRMEIFFKTLFWINITSIVYGPAIFFIKLSILLQYLRIFVPNRITNMPLFIGVHACIVSNFVFYFVDTAFQIAMCKPRKKIWNPLMTTGHCYDTDASFQATGVFNVVSDFAILFLPMPVLWGLQVPRREKILMGMVFATGFLACVTSIMRTYYTWKIVRSPDITYNFSIMGQWGYAETGVGIIVSCLPVLPIFFRHFGPKVYTSLSLASLSEALRSRLKSTGNTHKTNTSPGSSRPFTKRGNGNSIQQAWSGSYPAKAELKGQYINLDEYGLQRPGSAVLNGPINATTKSLATRRGDLERGKEAV